MKDNIEFLNYIYENARMGVISINDLLDYVEDSLFKELLNKELTEYEEVCDEAIKLFTKFKSIEKDLSSLTKVMTYMAIKMSKKTSLNKFAKMMIEGSNKGIIAITEKINEYPNAEEKIIKLAYKLLKTEQNNINELKKYL